MASDGVDTGFWFEARDGGELVCDGTSVVGIRKVASGLNTIIDVAIETPVGVEVVSFVGPRGRIKKFSKLLGRPI